MNTLPYGTGAPKYATTTQATGTACTVTLAAVAGGYNVIDAIHTSTTTVVATSALLSVVVASTTVFQAQVNQGATSFLFEQPIVSGVNEAIVVTLSNDSGTRYLNVIYR